MILCLLGRAKLWQSQVMDDLNTHSGILVLGFAVSAKTNMAC
jgi:hypothetical protein